MRRIGWVTIVGLCFVRDVFGQSGLCNSGVPFFLVDLTGQPGGTYISSSISRNEHCCGTDNPDRCIEFQIILDPAAVGINFEIYSGAQPSGSLYYQINCGAPVPVGQQICLSGTGPHALTFCKPGNNKNQYRISSIQGYAQSADVTTVEDCSVDLQVTGLVDSTIVWRDLTAGGYYESFLSCISGCANASFATQTGFPPFVDFEVCGRIYSSVCQSIMQTICDTIKVNIEPGVNITVTPDPAVFCASDSMRLLTADILPRKSNYIISWHNGPNGAGSVVGNDTFFNAPMPGLYSIVAIDTSFALCSSDTVNIPITFIPSPQIVIAPDDTAVCAGENMTISVSGAQRYLWSPSASLSCDTCSSVIASPASTTTYSVTGRDDNGCISSDTMTLTVVQPKLTSLNFSLCDGDSAVVGSSVYYNAGTYYDTFTSSTGCDSIVTSMLQIRNTFSVLVDTVICNGSSLTVGSTVYSVSGIYHDTLIASTGCDSIVETHLAIHPVAVCDNPDLTPCPQRIIFVLDESGSISGMGGSGVTNVSPQVRSAASGLISSLAGTGSQVAVVEFNSTARRAVIGGLTGYQSVNAAYISNFNTYIAQDANSTGSASNYDPEDYSCTVPQSCYTNWEDAFEEVQSINSTLGLATLVIFFTDGQPTAYNNSWGDVTVGTGAAAIAQALSEATAAANLVQMQGSHNFVIGLPNTTLPEANVQQISGLERFPDMQQSFLKADYTISSSAQLVNSVAGIAQMMCQADLRLEKTVNDSSTCSGNNVIFSVIVTNEGNANATGVEVKDYLPNGYTYVSDDGAASTSYSANTVTWSIGNLNAGRSDTLQITAAINTSGNYKNAAEVTASNQPDADSAPINDDGDQSEDDEDAVTVSVLNCDDGNLCTNDFCVNGACTHNYIPPACSIAGDNEICMGENTQFTASGGVAYSWSGSGGFSNSNANTSSVSAAGLYSVTVTDGNGCTNTCSVTLSVHPLPSCSITGETAICSGENTSFAASGGSSYSWTGPGGFSSNNSSTGSINSPGNYSLAVANDNGCTAACSMFLTQLPNTFSSVNDSVCSGEVYIMAGKSYTTSGTYTDTVISANGCDSIIELNLQVLPLTYGPFNIAICDGDSVIVGSSVYKNNGVYYDTFISHFGCDSIVISDVQVLNHSQTVINTSLCAGDSLIAGSSVYTNSGVYTDTLIAANGCDSLVQINLTVLPVLNTFIDTAICSGDYFVAGISIYSAAGTYFDTITAASGCDSIIQTNLQVLPVSTTAIDTAICSGGTFVAGSSIYNSAGNYSDTLVASSGCDSIVHLDLQILSLAYGTFAYTICQDDSIVVGSSVYKNSGIFNDTFISSNGCDSIVTSTIQVLNHSQSLLNFTICNGESIMVGNSTHNATGVYADTLASANGCDSIIQTSLVVLPNNNTLLDTAICSGDYFVVGTSSYSLDATYLDTLTAVNGCDSIVQTNLQVLPVSTTIIDTAICSGETFVAGSSNYSAAGNYTDTLVASNGCDSVIFTNLAVYPVVTTQLSISICEGDSVQVGNSAYTASGTYTDMLISALGCDSIVQSSITVINASRKLIDTVLCEGSILGVGNSSYDSTGIYFDTLIASSGCDSIIQTNIRFLRKSYSTINPEICQGQIFFAGGTAFSSTGVYQHIEMAANGCDSVVTINLQVQPAKFLTMVMSICNGDSVVFGNSVCSSSGTYLNTFKTFHGCDSIVQLQLSVLPEIGGTQDRIVCEGANVQFNITGGIQYEWFPATGLSCSNCPNPSAAPAEDISYTVRVTDIHQCTGYDTIHIDLNEVEVSLDISDNEVCEGDTITFSGTYSSDFPQQTTRWDFGDGFHSAHQYPVHAYFREGTYSINLTVTDSLGCSAVADTSITVNPRPEIIVTADTAICMGDNVQLMASGAASCTWMPVDNLDNPHIANPVAKPASNIQYNVEGVSANGCLNHASINITVNPLPDLFVSDDAAVCPNGSAVIYAMGGTGYSWYPPKGLSDDSSQFVAAAPQSSTTYRVSAMNEFGCLAMDSVHIEVYPKTDFKVGPNGEICKGDMVELTANGGKQYRWTPPYGLSCDECESPIASPVFTTKYAVAATDTYGCKYDDSVSVYVKDFPTVTTISDKMICRGESVLLETVAANAADFSWYPDLHLDNPKTMNPVASPDTSITYVVSVTNDLGCSVSDSVRLTVINKVDADLAGNTACPGERAQLSVAVNNASENGYQIQWLPANLFEDAHAAVQTLRPLHDVEVSVVVSSQTCEADTLSYYINLHDVPEVDAGDDRIVYLGEKIPLAATSASIINYYNWSPSERLECGECQSTAWIADRSRTFTVNVIDENGCAAKDSVTFSVVGNCRDDVFVPNAFTPNGDEINDRFMVRSQNQIKLNHFKIFDRWGKEVYSSNDIEEGWDGNYEDKEVFAGVYVYHLIAGCRNGQSVLVKGNVTVIR